MRTLILGCGLALAAAATTPGAKAALREFPACVTIDATGQKHRLIPLIDTGKSMNRITRSDRYDPDATYIIVLWSNGAESIIRMEGGEPTAEGSRGDDLQGNSWIVSTDLENCD